MKKCITSQFGPNHDIIICKVIYWTTYQTYIMKADLNFDGGIRLII